MTLQRPKEVASAERGHIDWTEGQEVWTIPAQNTKTGRPYTVPLGPLAARLFKAVFASHNHKWACPNQDGSGPVDTNILSRRWARARKIAGSDNPSLAGEINHCQLYDCRRMGRTLIEHQLGYSTRIAERCINHAERSDFSAHYDVADLSGKVREAMLEWGQLLEESLA